MANESILNIHLIKPIAKGIGYVSCVSELVRIYKLNFKFMGIPSQSNNGAFLIDGPARLVDEVFWRTAKTILGRIELVS